MSEVQEATIITTLNRELENQPNQVVLIDPKKDKLLNREVSLAVERVKNPVKEDARFENKQDRELLILLQYMTNEHPVLSKYERAFVLDENGDFDANPNHVGGLPEGYNAFQDDQPESLGELISLKGDLCYGQSIFASTVLDQLDIENGVVQFISNNPEEPDHAVVAIKSSNDNIIFDPMLGAIIHQHEHNEAYDALYGDMIPLGYIKEPNQKITIAPSND